MVFLKSGFMKSKVQVLRYCICGKILHQGKMCSICWNSPKIRKQRKDNSSAAINRPV